jgi:hypothetical protein
MPATHKVFVPTHAAVRRRVVRLSTQCRAVQHHHRNSGFTFGDHELDVHLVECDVTGVRRRRGPNTGELRWSLPADVTAHDESLRGPSGALTVASVCEKTTVAAAVRRVVPSKMQMRSVRKRLVFIMNLS